MNLRAVSQHKYFKPILGAVLMSLCGVALWQSDLDDPSQTRLGDPWINASYDYLFRFGARPVTNKVALILLDNTAYAAYSTNGQARSHLWDRSLHARLLDKLATDGCPLVVLDFFFRSEGKLETDEALIAAMRGHGRIVLMADAVIPEHHVGKPQHLEMEAVQIELPHKRFLEAATNWGVGKAAANYGGIPRRHWPFPAPTSFSSLPWTAAKLAGARLPVEPVRQWLRYYGENGPWASFSYHVALVQPPGYFRDTIVFVGSDPKSNDPRMPEDDKFSTPYTRWNDQAVGGVKIMATTFLNLVNRDWLQRPAPWVELLVFLGTGVTLGAIPFLARPLVAGGITLVVAAAALLVAVLLNYLGGWWFPWLIVAGAQAPGAMALTLAQAWRRREPVPATTLDGTVLVPEGQTRRSSGTGRFSTRMRTAGFAD